MAIIATPVLTSEWVTTSWIAYHYKRSIRMVRIWCLDGTLVDFGFRVYQDANKRWWIRPPDNN